MDKNINRKHYEAAAIFFAEDNDWKRAAREIGLGKNAAKDMFHYWQRHCKRVFKNIPTPSNYPEVQKSLEEIFYAIGLSPPNYPVPAIRHEFEFGYELGVGPVLLHATYGVYDG